MAASGTRHDKKASEVDSEAERVVVAGMKALGLKGLSEVHRMVRDISALHHDGAAQWRIGSRLAGITDGVAERDEGLLSALPQAEREYILARSPHFMKGDAFDAFHHFLTQTYPTLPPEQRRSLCQSRRIGVTKDGKLASSHVDASFYIDLASAPVRFRPT